MKIYTKTGDKGETSLFGGKRVPKYNLQIDAYGTIDELNSFLGLVRDYTEDKDDREYLLKVQDQLFTIGAIIAYDRKNEKSKIPVCHEEWITAMEKEIDRLQESVPPMKYFILPGGHKAVSFCNVARTVCRRAERRSLEVNSHIYIDHNALTYLNRLSDYLFALGRKLAHDLKAEENPWIPEK